MLLHLYHQLSFLESFSDCQNKFIDDSPSFFQILSQHFDLDDFISASFYAAFYHSIGCKRTYPLQGFLAAFILQKIFSIPTNSLLLIFLHLCKELRSFCGFNKIPDAPLMSRFKLNFEPYIELMFQHMADYTEPICQLLDSSLAQILTFDTSGIELFVSENNPKTLNALIKRLKTFYKDRPNIDPHMMAYCLMPSQAASFKDAKQMYINGHFCYADYQFAAQMGSLTRKIYKEHRIMEWIGEIVRTRGLNLAIDGKALRAATEKVKNFRAPMVMNVIDTVTGLILAQQPIPNKDSEITAIQELLKVLDIRDSIITIDAIGTQTVIMKQIIEQGGHFVLTVKKNQLQSYEELMKYFREMSEDDERQKKGKIVRARYPEMMESYEEVFYQEKNRDRYERRLYRTCNYAELLTKTQKEWPSLKTVGQMRQVRIPLE